MLFKKSLWIFSAFCLCFFNALPTTPVVLSASEKEVTVKEAGEEVAVLILAKKKVTIVSADGKKRKGKIKAKVYTGDTIITGKKSLAQVLFKGGTLFKFAPNTSFVVNDYVFDEEKQEAKFDASLEKGTLSTITGGIGKIAPQNYKLKTSTATIGIRGTNFAANMDKVQVKSGSIDVQNNSTGQTVVVLEGTQVEIETMTITPVESFTLEKEADGSEDSSEEESDESEESEEESEESDESEESLEEDSEENSEERKAQTIQAQMKKKKKAQMKAQTIQAQMKKKKKAQMKAQTIQAQMKAQTIQAQIQTNQVQTIQAQIVQVQRVQARMIQVQIAQARMIQVQVAQVQIAQAQRVQAQTNQALMIQVQVRH